MIEVEDEDKRVSSPINTVDPFMRVNKFKNAGIVSNVTQRDHSYKSHNSNGVKKARYSVNESIQYSSQQQSRALSGGGEDDLYQPRAVLGIKGPALNLQQLDIINQRKNKPLQTHSAILRSIASTKN